MKKSYTPAFKAQVVLELLKETKTLSHLSSEYGVHPNVLRDWKQIALKGLPDVFAHRDSVSETRARAAYERQLEALYAEIGRLTTHVNFLKKVALLRASERRALVERRPGALPLSTQANLLAISRRSLYYQPSAPPAEDVAIKHRTDELYTPIPSTARAS